MSLYILTVFLMLLTIALLLACLWYEHKEARQRERRLFLETQALQNQMDNIFTALRDEVTDQITQITKHKKLSQREQVVVERLTEAVTVSEVVMESTVRAMRIGVTASNDE